jgi:phosphohistidine phosphatase
MKKTITLIRHAEAVFSEYDGDHQRPLTEQGVVHAQNVALKLKRGGVVFDQIHTSDSLRTQQTTSLLNQKLQCSDDHVFIRDNLYCATVTVLMEAISQLDNQVNHVAMVAHNPGLTVCCEQLMDCYVAPFAPATVMTVNLCVDDWRAVGAGTGITCHAL